MEDIENYQGHLLAAHPKRSKGFLSHGVVLVIDQDHTGSLGLQINKQMTSGSTLASVMSNMDLTLDIDQPLYMGGSENTNRIMMLHSLDWTSPTTTAINDCLGLSNDVSVLAAIAAGEGPQHYRAIAGFLKWPPGHLEGEISGDAPWHDLAHSWSTVPADLDLVFGLDGQEQWHHVIESHARLQIASWF
jgi:putative transcriptional regulator